jgi:hydrolase, TatD family
MLIDTHAHINDPRLLPEAERIYSNLEKDGLSAAINIGYDRPSSEVCLDLANKFEKFYAVLGVHPHDSRLATKEDYDFFAKNASDPKVVAIGETGLDYYYDHSERETQKKVFIEHLELADSLKLPVVIHLRDAYQDMLSIFKEKKSLLNSGVVLHCYSGSVETLREFLKFDDIYFSYGGAITFKNTNKKEVVLATPRDRVLLETDCPYMTPAPHRGETNYPAYINLVRDKMREWIDGDIDEITTENAKRLFKKLN